jgi:hypothetical protein
LFIGKAAPSTGFTEISQNYLTSNRGQFPSQVVSFAGTLCWLDRPAAGQIAIKKGDKQMQNAENRFDSAAIVRGAAGALLGALAGSAMFVGLLKIGLYALIIPGALAGMGGAWMSRVHSRLVGVLCIVIGAAATILCEWSQFPFVADDSLIYFVTHINTLRSMAMLLGGLGIVLAYAYGKGSASIR